jgi:tRNA A-37 threonylcarbamoyl transferase component Bud32
MTFTDPEQADLLGSAGLLDFERTWQLNLDPVEQNVADRDRGRWGTVCPFTLENGSVVYLKRQQNYFHNQYVRKLLKTPTFRVELSNWKRLKKIGLPTMRILHYGERKLDGNKQAILISEGLEPAVSVLHRVDRYLVHGWPPREELDTLIHAVARAIREMHAMGVLHNTLRADHVFVDSSDRADLKVSFIDFERTKFNVHDEKRFIDRDLYAFHRWIKDRDIRISIRFLRAYFGISRMGEREKALFRKFGELDAYREEKARKSTRH